MEQKVDMREVTFLAFRTALQTLQDDKEKQLIPKDCHLVILTNFGQILYRVDEDKSGSIGKELANIILKIRDSTLEQIPPDMTVTNDCKMLVLENVTVVPFANPQASLTYSVLTLFTDEIVGITFGKPTFNFS